MGKGSSTGNVDPAVQQGMLSNESALVKIAQQQSANSGELFKGSFPGFQTAESFYQDLATGDPSAIMRTIAPAAQQTAKASEGAKKNILANAPAGGEKNLALEEVDVNRGAAIGNMASEGYLNAPGALAKLAGQGVGESISAAGTGISGYSAGSSSLGQLGGLEMQGQQIQAQNKGSTMGLLGSLAGDATSLGTAGMLSFL